MGWFFKSEPTVAVTIPRDVSQWNDQTGQALERLLVEASPRNATHLGKVLDLVNRLDALMLESPDGRRLGHKVLDAPRQRLSVYGAEVQRYRQALVYWAKSAKARQRLQAA